MTEPYTPEYRGWSPAELVKILRLSGENLHLFAADMIEHFVTREAKMREALEEIAACAVCGGTGIESSDGICSDPCDCAHDVRVRIARRALEETK
jgi:predicted nucleic acid-binding Zn ribbon protein